MLQDIAPHIYHNEIIFPEPAPEDDILVFSGNTVLGREQDGRFVLPRVRELALPPERLQYLFSVDGANYWLLMKRKQFIKGTEQIAQEGAIQIFKVPGSGMEEVIVGVVGTLQFDVFQYRMRAEYGVELRMTGLPYEQLRFIVKAPVADLKDLNLTTDAELLEDYRGRSLLVFASLWSIDYIVKRNPGLELAETAQ